MAKILLGPTVIGIRGTVAGMTFSQNRGGPYARGWHQPPNPRTQKQLTQRGSLAGWAVAWRSLAAADKTTWRTYAAAAAQQLTDSLGQPYYANGMNWYVTVNTARAQMGLVALATAPVAAAPAAPTVESVNFSISTATHPKVKIAAASPTIALFHQCWIVIVNSQGIGNQPAVVYLMRTAVPNASRDLELGPQAFAKFGIKTIEQKCFFETNALSAEGRYGASTFNQANATA